MNFSKTLLSVAFTSFAILMLSVTHPAFAQTISMTPGAGASASAACVSANNCFSPNPLTVGPGTIVTWTNDDQVSHTVTSGLVSDGNPGSLFDSALVKPGQTFQFTFSNAGTYNYFCAVHPWMTGQVIVSGNSQNQQQYPPPPSISVSTDKSSYNYGDAIITSGFVNSIVPNQAVTLQLYLPGGTTYGPGATYVPNSDGSYRDTTPSLPANFPAGTYTLVARYAGAQSQTTFYYAGPPPLQESISIYTDKTSYNQGDIITISGSVSPVVPNQVVMLQILNSDGSVRGSPISLTPSSAGSFSYHIPTSTSSAIAGTYAISASYGNAKNQISFTYSGPTPAPKPQPIVDVDNGGLRYKMIFVDSVGQCTDNQRQALQFYQAITDQYLQKYGLSPSPQTWCVSKNDLTTALAYGGNYAVQIIIPDIWGSIPYTLNSSILGEYVWAGNYRAIMSTAYSITPEGDLSAWTLSHELSHFILNYKGYPPNIYVDWVHAVQKQKDICQANDSTLATCQYLWTAIQAPSGRAIPVMKIYDGPPPVTTTNTPTPTPSCPSGYFYHASDNLCYRVVAPSLTLQTPSVNGLDVTISGQSQAITFGSSINKISWDWGDGYTVDGDFPQSHSYSQAGSYNVKVTAYDSFGSSTWVSETATVTNPAPVPQQQYALQNPTGTSQTQNPFDSLTATVSPTGTLNIAGTFATFYYNRGTQIEIIITGPNGNQMADQSFLTTEQVSQSMDISNWGDGTYDMKVKYGKYESPDVYFVKSTNVNSNPTPPPTTDQSQQPSQSSIPTPSPTNTQTQQSPQTQPSASQTYVIQQNSDDGLIIVSLSYIFGTGDNDQKYVTWQVHLENAKGDQIPESHYAIEVTQDGIQLLHQTDDYASNGSADGEINNLPSFDPLTFKITYVGRGAENDQSLTGPIGTMVTLEAPNSAPQPQLPPTPKVTLSIDKTSYKKGDTIIISGTITNWPNNLLSVSLMDSDKNIIGLQPWNVASDGTISEKIDTSNVNWKSGTYSFETEQGSIATFQYDDQPSSDQASSYGTPDQNKGKTCFLFWCW